MTPNEVQMVTNEVRVLAGEMRTLGESNARLEERVANHIEHEDDRWDRIEHVLGKVDRRLENGDKVFSEHSARLQKLEGDMKGVKWIGATVATAIVGMIITWLKILFWGKG